jgi:hypothetical protein
MRYYVAPLAALALALVGGTDAGAPGSVPEQVQVACDSLVSAVGCDKPWV